MMIIAINLDEGDNKEYYHGKSRKFRKEWKELLKDPKNHYDPIIFYKNHGRSPKHYEIIVDGEPTTIQEKLIKALYLDELTYMMINSPEDFVESRISYETLKDYADDMKYFISDLISMI